MGKIEKRIPFFLEIVVNALGVFTTICTMVFIFNINTVTLIVVQCFSISFFILSSNEKIRIEFSQIISVIVMIIGLIILTLPLTSDKKIESLSTTIAFGIILFIVYFWYFLFLGRKRKPNKKIFTNFRIKNLIHLLLSKTSQSIIEIDQRFCRNSNEEFSAREYKKNAFEVERCIEECKK